MKVSFLAFALLFLSSSAASTQELCSPRGEPPAKLTFTTEGDSQFMTLQAGDKSEKFEFVGSAGTGLNGSVYIPTASPESDGELLLHTTIQMDTNEGHLDEPEILIFRDRVFWPCDR